MPRWPLLALVALALAVPAASAGTSQCARGVINDWYVDGTIDKDWDCGCIREAVASLPEDGRPASGVKAAFDAAEAETCPRSEVLINAPAPSEKPEAEGVNWPARISATVLMVVTIVLLYWRRRGGRFRR